jgi:hypothetical protein
MAPILLVYFTDEEGAIKWRGFSSSDENRSMFHLRKDVLHEIGYQESHPEDKTTTYGLIGNYFVMACDINLEHRAGGIQLVLTPGNGINDEYSFLTATESYAVAIPDGHTVTIIPHTFVDPNPYYTGMANTDSDSD